MSDAPGFADSLRAGVPATLRGLWVTFLTPFGLEVVAGSGADWIGVDLQHGDLHLAQLAPLLRATDAPVLARLGSHDPAALARAIDAGVDGVIVPTVESAAEAERLVAAAHLPPRGRRSGGHARAGLVGAPERPLLLPMVETRRGLAAADEIAAIPGIDGIFVGPYDLALSLGKPVRSEKVLDAIHEALAAARRHGRITGAFTGDPGLVADLDERGAVLDLHAVDTDAAALRAGLAALLEAR
ncbi:HpcH/HpaI aldolase/citrate lyase family protein [Nocardioides sp. NPDC057772]|uniref:HpcH/HpaI aldolase family protein n=1 Tax=Nocardioides sp. NPDC057772 TaxID=3346245 RepID=UPI0036730A54